MTQKSPSYQWYPKDAISSARIAMMSLQEEGAYRRALDFCWLTGSLPADTSKLARIIGKGCTPKIAESIKAMFIRSKTNRTLLVHDRLEAERSKQVSWREKSAKGGRQSAASRWEGVAADDTVRAKPATASPAVKSNKATVPEKKTSALLTTLHAAQVEEMMAGKYAPLSKAAILKKLDEEFPAGYEFRDDRHVFNAFKHTATAMLKALAKPTTKKDFDPMSRMRKLN